MGFEVTLEKGFREVYHAERLLERDDGTPGRRADARDLLSGKSPEARVSEADGCEPFRDFVGEDPLPLQCDETVVGIAVGCARRALE